MTKKCTHCGKKPVVEKYTPFCSARYADVDLGKWLLGSYAIPGKDGEANIPTLNEEDEY